MPYRIAVALAVLVLGVPEVGASGDPSSDIDEIRITSAYTPARGEFEVYQVADLTNDGGSKSGKIFTRFEYGVTDDFVLEFKIPFKYRRPKRTSNEGGIGDIVVEGRHRILREPAAPFAAAVGFEIGFPSGDEERGLGNGNFKYEPILSLGKELGAFHLHQDAKLELIRETAGGVEREGSATTALTWTPVEEIFEIEDPTLELALDWKWAENRRAKVAIIPAVRGEFEGLPIEVEFGLGFPIGLNRSTDRWGIISAFEFEF